MGHKIFSGEEPERKPTTGAIYQRTRNIHERSSQVSCQTLDRLVTFLSPKGQFAEDIAVEYDIGANRIHSAPAESLIPITHPSALKSLDYLVKLVENDTHDVPGFEFNGDGVLPPGDHLLTREQLRASIFVLGPRHPNQRPDWDAGWRLQRVENLEILVRQPWPVGIDGLRIARGMTQRELARNLKVDESLVSRDERNEYHGVTVERAKKILDAPGVRLVTRVEVEPIRESSPASVNRQPELAT